MGIDMAPKQRPSKRSAKAKAVPKPLASSSAASSSAPTLVAEASQTRKRHRQQLGRRDSEEVAERCLQQHVGHFSKTHMETMRVDGLLAREKVLQAVREKRANNDQTRLGATFWRRLVEDYSIGLMGIGSLGVTNKELPVHEQLSHGLICVTRSNPATRTCEPLVVHLQHCKPMNQREFVGLVKAIHANQGMGRPSQDTIYVEIVKYIVRTGADKTLAHEFEVMKPTLDAALSRQFLRLKGAGVQMQTWVEEWGDVASLFLDRADLDAVMVAQGSWKDVAPQIARLTASGQLGSSMFAFASQLVHAASFGSEVEILVVDFMQTDCSEKQFASFKAKCEEKIKFYSDCGLVYSKRNIAVEFLGFSVPLTVQSMDSEWEVRMRVALKAKCLGLKDGLPMLPYEEWLVQVDGKEQCTVPDFFLKLMKRVRLCAIDMLKDSKITCLADMQKIIASRSTMLLGFDRSFVVELEFLSH